MPVIRNIPLELEAGEVLRRQGIGGRAGIRPEIEALLLQLLSGVCDEGLLEPSLAYEIYPVTEIGPEGSSLVPPSLPGVAELAVAVGTIGPRLETRVAELNSRGEPLRGLLLDGIGSAAVDSLTMATCRIIGDEAVSRGYRVSSPVSPGMPGLPITEQRRLLEMVPAGEIGVGLSSSGMMVPRKSASMVMGIGVEMATWTRAEVCARCNLRQTCRYQILAATEE